LRKLMMLSCLGCLALTLVALAPSAFAEGVTACKMNSSAHYTPGLNTSSKAFTYTFRGQLNGCRSSEPGGLEGSGSIEAGQTKNEEVVNSTTGATDVVTYQEPVPTGTGSCATSTTTGTALVSWPVAGTFTVESYSTTGGNVSVLSGNVQESMTLTAVNAKPGDPTTFTITTNLLTGDTFSGHLQVEAAASTACTTSAGATSGELNGELLFHNP